MNIFLFSLASFLLIFFNFIFSKKYLTDYPNKRSLHNKPKPTSGGMAFIILIPYIFFNNELHFFSYIIFFIGLIGILDDLLSLSSKLRLIIYLIITSILIFNTDLDNLLLEFKKILFFEKLIYIFLILLFVWIINLINFMDGIDGLVCSHIVLHNIFICLYYYYISSQDFYLLNAHVIIVLTIFLIFNWHPSKIFMGNVGSSIISLMVVCLILLNAQENIKFFWVWMILLSTFIIDTTLTVINRIIKKENIFNAHSNHLYQILVKKNYKQDTVSFLYLLYCLIWLHPLCLLILVSAIDPILITFIAYFPTICIKIILSNKYESFIK